MNCGSIMITVNVINIFTACTLTDCDLVLEFKIHRLPLD